MRQKWTDFPAINGYSSAHVELCFYLACIIAFLLMNMIIYWQPELTAWCHVVAIVDFKPVLY